MSASDPAVLRHQAAHARYRAVELRATAAAVHARQNASEAAASLVAIGAPRIDDNLPDNPIDAAAVLEARAARLDTSAANELAKSRC